LLHRSGRLGLGVAIVVEGIQGQTAQVCRPHLHLSLWRERDR